MTYSSTNIGITNTKAEFIASSTVNPQLFSSPELSTEVATTRQPPEIVATLVPPPTRKIHVYTQANLALLSLKCPSVHSFCDGRSTSPVSEAHASNMTRLLAQFDGGKEMALNIYSQLPNFNQVLFDADIEAAVPNQPELTCVAIKQNGCVACPKCGCISPSGVIVSSPLQLLTWTCNTDEVGARILAKSVIATSYSGEIFLMNEALYARENGVLTRVTDSDVERQILSHVSIHVSSNKINQVLKMIKTEAINLRNIDPEPNLICLNNGVFNVSTKALEPHNGRRILINRIPHVFSADATCTRFLAFLESIWGHDQDYAAKVQFIRQWIGYSLVADTSMQKMLILVGQGANGKSILMDIMQAILGKENVASAMLNRFDQSYVRATVEHKLANFSADLPKKTLTADGQIKAIISGDNVEVALKHKPSRTIKPYVRLVVATNNMPDCHDTSDGFHRRIIILPFTRQFAENERDPNLLQSLLPEIPGIISWALDGLYELRGQGRFTIPESSLQTMQSYRQELSAVRMFSQECLVASTDRAGLLSKDLFSAFKMWCGELGFPAGNIIALGRELSTMGFDSRKSGQTFWLVRPTDNGERYFPPAQNIPEPEPVVL